MSPDSARSQRVLGRSGFPGVAFVAVVSLLSGGPADGLSLPDVPLSQMSLEELLQVEVEVGTGSPQTLSEVPATVSIITREQIESMGAVRLSEVLESVPGLHRYPVLDRSLDPAYSIRGLNTTGVQVLLLVDGIPVSQLLLGGPLVGFDPPTTSIERIEVVRGPGSAVYGADAFAGVFNIVTKNGSEAGTRAGARVGSYGFRSLWAEHARSHGDWNLYVGVDWMQSDGDDGRIVEADLQSSIDDLLGTAASLAPGPLSTDYEQVDVHASLSDERWTFRLWGGERTFGHGVGGAPILDPEGSFESSWGRFDVEHRHEGPVGWRFEETAYLHYHDGSPFFVLNPPGAVLPIGSDGNPNFAEPQGFTLFPDGLIGAPGVQQVVGGVDFVAHYDGIEGHRFRWNVGLVRQTADTRERKNFGPGVLAPARSVADPVLTDVSDTEYIYLQDHDRDLWYLSAQDRWALSQDWELTIGLRYDHYSDFGGTFNPRLALVWSARPELTAKLLYGSAFHGPGFGQQFGINSPSLGNPELQPEMIDIVEAVLDHRPRRNVRWVASLFAYEARDLIELVPEGPNVARTQNMRDQEAVGGEVELFWEIDDRFELSSNLAWVDVSQPGPTPDRVPAVAELQAFVGFGWQLAPSWTTSLRGYWISERRRVEGDPRPATPSYTLADLVVRGWEVLPNLDLTFTVHNLMDEEAREPTGPQIPGDLPLPGRSLRLAISYRGGA